MLVILFKTLNSRRALMKILFWDFSVPVSLNFGGGIRTADICLKRIRFRTTIYSASLPNFPWNTPLLKKN